MKIELKLNLDEVEKVQLYKEKCVRICQQLWRESSQNFTLSWKVYTI